MGSLAHSGALNPLNGSRGGSSLSASRARIACAAQNPRIAAAAAVGPETSTSQQQKQQYVDDEAKYVLNTYGRPADPDPLVITHGLGSKLYDCTGKEYLDFAAGIAVNCLGHSDPRWVESVVEQAGKLAHTSNLFHTLPQVDLAKRLVENSFADKVFFCNSGTEANEAAIKFARKYARQHAGVDPYDADAAAPYGTLSMTSAFHGRTLGALALTAKVNYRAPFGPLMGGHEFATFNDIESVRAVLDKGQTAAVFVEPLQGEGGVNPCTRQFLESLRAACDDCGALLVFDEVQCGVGRTGKLFAYEHYGVQPDIMTLAKPLAAGLPIGAVLMTQAVADAMAPGDHGSTFAGSPFVCAAAVTTFDIVADSSFLQEVADKGEALRAGLRDAVGDNPHVVGVRGEGLLCGVQLDVPAGPVVAAARAAGLIVITAGAGDVVRLAPPLTVTREEIQECVRILGGCMSEALAA